MHTSQGLQGQPSQNSNHQRVQNGKPKVHRNFLDDQKAAIVRRHLADKVPVRDLAEEYYNQPSQIYLWVKPVLE